MNGFATYSMIVRSSLIPSFERYLDGVTSFDTYIHTYIHAYILTRKKRSSLTQKNESIIIMILSEKKDEVQETKERERE